MKLEKIKSQIPGTLVNRIKEVEQCSKKQIKDYSKDKIAVFDLDNTLLEGDIGDAVFIQLKKDEKKEPLSIDKKMIPFTWQEYQEFLRTKGKREAYKQIVTSMAGIPLETFVETTRRVMASEAKYLELGDIKVPVPFPNRIMKAVVLYLKILDYKIFVISASNHYSVLYVAWEFFGIPESNVFGMKSLLFDDIEHGSILGNEIDGPVTVEEGKAEVFRKFIGTVSPLITAGDSTTDIQVLNLTDAMGLCIWVGNDEKQYESIKQIHDNPETVYFLYRER